MGKILMWGEISRRDVEITVHDLPKLPGQGDFMIDPETVTITFERRSGFQVKGDSPERVREIKVRGECDGGPAAGLRAWYPYRDDHDPADVPDWVQELIEIFSIHDDLADQLRAQRKSIKWLRDDS